MQYRCTGPDAAAMRILLFAGTTEGRQLTQAFQELCVYVYVSTATEYGKESALTGENIETKAGRMDEAAMIRFIEGHRIDLVIDATHPFARVVTDNIKKACTVCGVEYIRCLRARQELDERYSGNVVWKNSVEEAVEYLKQTEGKVLIATGSKELKLYTEIGHYQERCCARVLSTKEAVEESSALGFKGPNLIAMQGPFSKEMNIAMLKAVGASYFVTKESGKAGGFVEKAEAARETGAVLVVIARPEETGISPQETLGLIRKKMESSGTA